VSVNTFIFYRIDMVWLGFFMILLGNIQHFLWVVINKGKVLISQCRSVVLFIGGNAWLDLTVVVRTVFLALPIEMSV